MNRAKLKSGIDTRNAEKQRRHRERARLHLLIAPVPVNGAVINVLESLHWLDEKDAADRSKVGDAIGRLLLDLAEGK